MHDSAMHHAKLFFDTYLRPDANAKIVDIGSQDVNGSLREVLPPGNRYIGVDFEDAIGVDVVLEDPYMLPFESDSIDFVVSSSCFEHSEFFWELFTEIIRILKPAGIFYLNAPSNGVYHRYPVDCFRFFPDAGVALSNWANRQGYKTSVLESFVGNSQQSVWNDFVAVFIKDTDYRHMHPDRIITNYRSFTNGHSENSNSILNYSVEIPRKITFRGVKSDLEKLIDSKIPIYTLSHNMTLLIRQKMKSLDANYPQLQIRAAAKRLRR